MIIDICSFFEYVFKFVKNVNAKEQMDNTHNWTYIFLETLKYKLTYEVLS